MEQIFVMSKGLPDAKLGNSSQISSFLYLLPDSEIKEFLAHMLNLRGTITIQ